MLIVVGLSCVRTIKDALSTLTPPPITVDVSVVTQSITIRHSSKLSHSTITSVIDDAGFDVVTVPFGNNNLPDTTKGHSPFRARKHAKHIEQCTQCQLEKRAAGPSDNRHEVTLSIGGMTCASCSGTITRTLSDLPGVSEVAINLLGNSGTLLVDLPERVDTVVEAIEDAGYEAEVISVTSTTTLNASPGEPSLSQFDGAVNLVLSIGGMTCVSCSNTIMALASDIPGVSEVNVNLIGKSATARIQRRDLAEQLKQAIEDAGYDVDVVSVEPLQTAKKCANGPRTVDLRIDGMFCL